MKRFSIFCAALFAAVTSFAAVTYELNGGVTNDYGWQTKNDMFQACMQVCGVTGLASLDELKAAGDASYTTICSKLTDVSGMMNDDRFEWLELYIMTVQNAAADDGATTLEAGVTSAGWRYAVAAFFLESQRAGWPRSADFSAAGKDETYIPSWKHAYDNPTNPTAEWVLNAPYKENATFKGWYTTSDFSGAEVTKIDATTTGTLYAKWGAYVYTTVEARALEAGSLAGTKGVVNHIDGNDIYIQDGFGGLLLSATETPTCKVGEEITVTGVLATVNGAPVLNNVAIESVKPAAVANPKQFETLVDLKNDVSLQFFATRIKLQGLKIVAYDAANCPTLQDLGGNEALAYNMPLDPAKFPLGSKVVITAVAGWNNGFQFVGDVAGVVTAPVAVKDTYEYPARYDGQYTLTNNWVYSDKAGNFAANSPGKTDYVRGMAVNDGKMYFINRDLHTIVVVDGKTGAQLDPIVLDEHLFQAQDAEGNWALQMQYGFNDIKFDQAGHCLIGVCMTSEKQHFMIYIVDVNPESDTYAEATLLLDERLADNPDFVDLGIRFDAFGVAGDVTQNGVIMAADASGTWNVYRWLITDGEVAPAEQIAILLDPAEDKSLFIDVAGFGTAPQIFPQDEFGGLYYVDGFNTMPMLFDELGMLLDDFYYVPTGVKVGNNAGDTITMNANFNGLVEFQVGEEYFLLMVSSNDVHAVPTTFSLFKFADAARSFEGLEPMWYFPAKGLGAKTNGCRTALPYVEVEDNKAHLYIYANNNGYASYTLTIGGSTAVENVETVKVGAEKVVENGQIFILKNGVKYNALGAQVK